MRILLDTNVLLWAVGRSRRLDAETIDALSDAANDVLFSAASIWEIAIKFALKRADFDAAPHDILGGALAIGFVELAVTAATAATVAKLPLIHRDPFDRLLPPPGAPTDLYSDARSLFGFCGGSPAPLPAA